LQVLALLRRGPAGHVARQRAHDRRVGFLAAAAGASAAQHTPPLHGSHLLGLIEEPSLANTRLASEHQYERSFTGEVPLDLRQLASTPNGRRHVRRRWQRLFEGGLTRLPGGQVEGILLVRRKPEDLC